jgi:hypothetical protein
MSQRGMPSTAHQYDRPRGQCVHCHMYQGNVEAMSHNCTPEREAIEDAKVLKSRVLAKEANDHGE